MSSKRFSITTFAGWADMDANAHMANFAYLNKCVDARMDLAARKLVAPPDDLREALAAMPQATEFERLPSSIRR